MPVAPSANAAVVTPVTTWLKVTWKTTLLPVVTGPGPAREIEVTAQGTYVNWSAGLVADVPPNVVTVTSTIPAEPAGDVAMIDVGLLTVKLVAAAVPNITAEAPLRFVPVIVTDVPPVAGPAVGAIPLTVGGAVYAN